MKHRTAILTLSSNSNSGDVAHVNSVCAALYTRMDFTQKLAIDTSSINDDLTLEDAARDYLKKISEFNGKYIVLATNDKSSKLLAYLAEQKLLDQDKDRSYIYFGTHQYIDDIGRLAIDHIVIPEAAIDTNQKIIIESFPNFTLTFAVPSSNPSIQDLEKSYHDWHHPNKPPMEEPSIIITLPGDAPDQTGKIKCFTRQSADELFEKILQLYESQGKIHKIIIQNSPRTGKHDQNGQVICPHEFVKGNDPSAAIDEISQYFTGLFDQKSIKYSFFNFAFEIDGPRKKALSVYNPLLYAAQSRGENFFILPAESVSMIGQVPLYLYNNQIIAFRPDSMNAAHEAILQLAIKKDYLSCFTNGPELVIPATISKRTEDDSIQVAADIVKGCEKKFDPSKNIIPSTALPAVPGLIK